MSYPILYPPANTTIYIPFATYDGATGASEAASGLAVTDIEIYKNGSVTQRASDAGYTLLDTDGLDFDGLTGINGFSIDLSDNTDAGFYTVGAWYWVIVSSITVDGQTVNFIAAMFRIMAAEGSSGTPKVDVSHYGGTAGTFASGRPEVNTTHWKGTAAATVDTNGYPVVTVKDGTGAGEIALTSGAVDTVTTLTNAPQDSAGVTTLLSRVPSGIFTGITSLAQWLGLIAGKQTGNSTARTEIRATGAGSGTFDETTDSVEAIRDRGDAAWITATGFSTHTAADVWAVATRALTDKAGFSLSAAGIQAVWDALTAALTTVGSIGKLLVDNINATISSRATQTSVDTVDDFLDTEIAAIKAKTDNLPTDPADASDVAASFTSLNTKVDTIDDFLDTEIAAIIAAIAALPSANANADALLDRAAGVETNRTVRQAMRLILAAVAGKLNGAATNQVTIRDTNDGVNRIVATVDADGNRTAVTLDAS